MKKLLLLLLLLPSVGFSQAWKRYRKEMIYSVGATNFLGDLGGANQVGTNYLKDLEIVMTRPSIGMGYRYRLDKRQFVKGEFLLGRLKGADQLTTEPFRNNRQIQVRTTLLEVSGQYEFMFNKDKNGHRYNIKTAKGVKGLHLNYYGFIGVGFAIFQPKGVLPNGQWVALRPLTTEGQDRPYLPMTFTIPMGGGIKYGLTRLLSIGMEVGMRKTFTDYLDDVSTNYTDPNALRTKFGGIKGDNAAYLSNPADPSSPNYGSTSPPNQRGDPTDKDAYMFVMFSLNQKIAPKRTKAKF